MEQELRDKITDVVVGVVTPIVSQQNAAIATVADAVVQLGRELRVRNQMIDAMAIEITQLREGFSESVSNLPTYIRQTPELKMLTSELDDRIKTLEDMAYIDKLTMMHSRHYLATLLDRERGPFVGMTVDIDHFKAINDVHGHEIGDKVLAGVASTIRDIAGAADPSRRVYTIRPGGEEFFVLASIKPGDPMEEASTIIQEANNVRKAVEAADYGGVKCTVSIGVSEEVLTLPLPGKDKEKVFQLCGDKYLLIAKENGRNRVCCDKNSLSVSIARFVSTTPPESSQYIGPDRRGR